MGAKLFNSRRTAAIFDESTALLLGGLRSSARSACSVTVRTSRSYVAAPYNTTDQTSRIQRMQESFFEPVDRVDVQVPATSANLGPGFDSLGLAMNVWNRLVVERANEFS